jgi:hypothetical protein
MKLTITISIFSSFLPYVTELFILKTNRKQLRSNILVEDI